jgi:hypothetical protein
MAAKPPIVADLTWIGDLKLVATIDRASVTFDIRPADPV